MAALSIFMAWWWNHHRLGLPWFIDEAGYLGFALDHAAAMDGGGVGDLWDSIDRQAPSAPLVPMVSAVGLLATDRPFGVAAGTMVVSLAGLIVSTWFLARWFLPPWWSVLAAATVGALPTVLTLTGSYYFAPAAAAFFIAGCACLLRSDWGVGRLWVAGAGVAFGLAALSRTMLIGFLPAVAVAAVVAVWARRDGRTRSRLSGLAVGVAALLAVLAPWFLTNLSAIVDYLGSDPVASGTGRGAGNAGRLPGIRDLRLLVGDLLVPMTLTAAAAAVPSAVAVADALRRRAGPSRLCHDSMALATVVLAGAATLVAVSQAVGQWLPLLPAVIVLVLAGIHRAAPRRVQQLAVAAFAGLAVLHVAEASRLVAPLSDLQLVDAGPLGRVAVTDTRTLLEDQLYQSLPDGTVGDEFRSVPLLLDALTRELEERSVAVGEPPVLLVGGGHDALVNINGLRLADELQDQQRELVIGALPLDHELDPSGWERRLDDPDHGQPNGVVTVYPFGRQPRALPAYEALLYALPLAGFSPVFEADLPDGRPVALWFRPRVEATP